MDVPGDAVSASESNVDLATVTCARTIPYFSWAGMDSMVRCTGRPAGVFQHR
jgi:hypothetical protein